MISLRKLIVLHEPFPMGLAQDVFEPQEYAELVKNFPPPILASRVGNDMHGYKYSIAEEFDGRRFSGFIRGNPAWQRFYNYTQSDAFFDEAIDMLDRNNLPLPPGKYLTRFEFSFLPGDIGLVNPHCDAPPKVCAFVLPMTSSEWPETWGGATDMLEPTAPIEPSQDKYVFDYSLFRPVLSCPFRPNSANFLMRTGNSWHGVKCNGPRDAVRRSVTLNIVDERYVN